MTGFIRLDRREGEPRILPATQKGFSRALEYVSAYTNAVIVRGAFGPDASAIHPEWIKALRRAANHSGASFIIQSWGRYIPFGNNHPPEHVCFVNVLTGEVTRPKMSLHRAAEMGTAEWEYFCENQVPMFAKMFDQGVSAKAHDTGAAQIESEVAA